MDRETKGEVTRRLASVEGHVRGIQKMWKRTSTAWM